MDAARETLATADVHDRVSLALVRFGSNAIFRLEESDLVLRVSLPSTPRREVLRTLAVARTLAERGVSVPSPRRIWDGEPCTASKSGAVVSAWTWYDETRPPPELRDLGKMLRQVHSLELSIKMPQWDPLGKTDERLREARATGKPPQLLNRLADELSYVRAGLTRARFELQQGPIHGDAHIGNLIRTRFGPLLLDLDDFCFGPREADLAPSLVGLRRFAVSPEEWDVFSQEYGYDLSLAPCSDILCRVRQLTMTSWLLGQWGHTDAINAEIERRVRSLDEDGPPWTKWSAR